MAKEIIMELYDSKEIEERQRKKIEVPCKENSTTMEELKDISVTIKRDIGLLLKTKKFWIQTLL
jgi:hypothetical protein